MIAPGAIPRRNVAIIFSMGVSTPSKPRACQPVTARPNSAAIRLQYGFLMPAGARNCVGIAPVILNRVC